MADYDKWKLASGQEDEPYYECEQCSNYIYKGMEYYKTSQGNFCDSSCFADYMKEYYAGRYKVAGEE
jgi:hypothetical protein